MNVRLERPGDVDAIGKVNDEAFGGADESRIVAAVRSSGGLAISFVALDGEGAVIGHILFTPVQVGEEGSSGRVAGLGPMAVVPGKQRQGVGSALVRAGLSECQRHGIGAVVVVGHPDYYPRFGFQPASRFGLRSTYDVPDEVFMALELEPGALSGSGGVVRYVPAFDGG